MKKFSCRLPVIFLFLFLIGAYSYAQDTNSTKNFKIFPFPIIGFSPETNLYFGGSVMTTFRIGEDTLTRRSETQIEVNYTLRNQLIIELEYDLALAGNSYFLYGNNGFLKFPEYFYGIGSETPESNEELYSARRIEIENTLLRRLRGNYYAGIRYRAQYMYDIEPLSGGLLETSSVRGRDGGFSSGLGLAGRYDTRKNILNPEAGAKFAQISSTFFHKAVFSDYNFIKVITDLRYYLKTWPGHVLAVQNYNELTPGNVPFRMLSFIGSESYMRGYYRGRYRDRFLFTAQAEYRLPVWRWIGAAVFAGGGHISSSLHEFNPLKWFAGGGIRIRVDKENNVNLRFDYAVGEDGNSGFYISFGEAF